MNWQQQLNTQRNFFNSAQTQSYQFRITQLQKLKHVILANEQNLNEALYKDLKKSAAESWVTEIGFVLTEINDAIKHLKKWMRPQKVGTNFLNFPAKSYTISEPLGVVLIIAPWNYPLNLLFTPLIGAMAAGNCVVLKNSEHAPATGKLMKEMIQNNFSNEYILFADGDGATVVTALMQHFVFDHVFYTGSTAVGKIIYKMAAENLVPVTLELGGKSPCVVAADAHIKIAARRIAFTKFSNAGQMCVAPDYVLVQQQVKDALIQELKKVMQLFFTNNPQTCPDYGRIINTKQFDRLEKYLHQGKILAGGEVNRNDLYIAPTLIGEVNLNDDLMQEEIFGPILPIISFSTQKDAEAIIAQNKNPLAFYIYSQSNQTAKRFINAIPFGGGCINNCSVHLLNMKLPFGGRGLSGFGHYHGKFSFDTFSHQKAILHSRTWFDPMFKYPPLKNKISILKKLMG